MENLDQLVRRIDEDRWLASRFASADVRARLIAICALNHELARIADVVKTPAAGDIRFAWWREALSDIAAGKRARAHPVLDAIAATGAPVRMPVVGALIEARARELDGQPFTTAAERAAYIDATAGGVMRLAIAACGGDAGAHERLVRQASLAWGYAGLLRAEAAWRARGWSVLAPEEAPEAMLELARAAYQGLDALPKAPAEIFPALGYVALAPLYLKTLKRGAPSLFARQARLVIAAATGRL